MTRAATVLVASVVLVSISAAAQTAGPGPVIVQGAMQIEVEKMASRLENVKVERVGAWSFWIGTVDGYPVIVSKTLKGTANAAAATVLAIEHFRPVAIINQGTAGGHEPRV